MKKIIILIAAVLTIVFTYPTSNFITMTDDFDGCAYIFYTDTAPIGYEKTVKNGDIYMTTIDKEQAEHAYKTLKNISAVTVRFNGSREKIEIYLSTLKAKEIKSQTIDGIYIVYAYSNKIKDSVEVSGETINVQIAIHRGVVTIGSPLIIGSF